MSDTVIIIINQLIGVVQRGYNHHQYMIKVKEEQSHRLNGLETFL